MLQLIIKCMFLLLARSKLIESMEFLSRVYEQNQNIKQNWPIFDAFEKLLNKCFDTVMLFYLIAFVGGLYGPFIVSMAMYFVYDDRYLVMPLVIPGTSLEIDDHYELNMILQLLIGQFCSLIYVYFDAISVLQMMHVILMANIVCHRIRATEIILLAKQPSHADVKINLRSVIQLQTEFCE